MLGLFLTLVVELLVALPAAGCARFVVRRAGLKGFGGLLVVGLGCGVVSGLLASGMGLLFPHDQEFVVRTITQGCILGAMLGWISSQRSTPKGDGG